MITRLLFAHPTHSSMANEGTLNLDCIAADPKSEYLYGIASANTSPHTNYADSHILLVRSNMDPINLASMTWSVVSSSTSSELSYNYPTFTSVDCTVSEQGDFTAFVRSPHRVFSETAMVPMGVRYIRQSGTWSNIYGPAVYGWISDAFVHKSFYMDDDLIHMVTGEYADRMRIGILDTSTNSLQLVTSNKWNFRDDDYDLFSEDGEFGRNADFNYTRQGFFSRRGNSQVRMVAAHNSEMYMTGLSRGRGNMYPSFSFSKIVGLSSDVLGVFEGPRTTFFPHYVFGGTYRLGARSYKESFFGSIGQINGVYKLYTTVRTGHYDNQSYVEHNITRSDTTTDFTVHENFQTVGGGTEEHPAFVVALTSQGLYEFGIFGPDAGNMRGPYHVVVPGEFSSLPSRVVTNFKDKTQPIEMMSSTTIFLLIGAVTLVFVLVAGLYERSKYNKNKLLLAEKERGEADDGGDEYSMSVSPGGDSHSVPYHSTVHINGASTDTMSLSTSAVTYQDQIRDLEFSSHPRPNVVTSIG